LIQFSKVFASLETTSIFYQRQNILSTLFLKFFSLLRAGRLSRNSLFIISSLLKLVNSFFKVLEPLRVRDKSLKTTFISYHPFG
ncbi:hypothetical protein EFM85_06520, partial [Streptococcus thermophilus]|nr:hypothetical protein [Streptococcus thermophilus]MCT2972198.1 hypothetical protein [Streptococcus thermophilus]